MIYESILNDLYRVAMSDSFQDYRNQKIVYDFVSDYTDNYRGNKDDDATRIIESRLLN